jgi:glycosyltransferase involved in cell wall biosynthesis
MRKIKILRILHRASVSGPTHHAAILHEYFNNDEYDSLLLVGSCLDSEANGEYILRDRQLQYSLLPISREFSLLNEIMAVYQIIKAIIVFKPDIIHTHASKPGFYGRLLGKFLGVKVLIHTFHGHVFHSYFGYFKTKFIRSVEMFLAYISTKLVVISEQQHSEIKKYIGCHTKFILIPLGLDLDKYFHSEILNRKKFRLQYDLSDKFCIGYSGRLTTIKDIPFFLDVAELILSEVPGRIKFVISGGGEEENSILERITKSKILSGNVILIGWQKNMEFFYHGIDCLFLTSKNEGTPVSIIEAICAGVECVSLDVGGVKDIFRNTSSGVLVPNRDARYFVTKFFECVDINCTMRLDIGKRNLCLLNYGVSKLTSSLDLLYRNLLHS